MVVPEIQLGTAYGVITSVQNTGLAIFPIIVGVINDKTGSYMWVEIFFAMLAGMGFISAIALVMEDKRTGNRLDKPTAKASTPSNADVDVNIRASINDASATGAYHRFDEGINFFPL